jgi:hypothetical protein
MAGGKSSAAEETAAAAPTQGQRRIDRQAVDRGIAYALMVAALVATYALHQRAVVLLEQKSRRRS